MTRTIIFVIAVLTLAALVTGCGQKEEQAQVKETAEDVQVVSAKVVDPVCGMSVDAGAAIMVEHEGKKYHFCSAHCKEKFLEDPEKHISGEEHHMEEESHEGHGR